MQAKIKELENTIELKEKELREFKDEQYHERKRHEREIGLLEDELKDQKKRLKETIEKHRDQILELSMK